MSVYFYQNVETTVKHFSLSTNFIFLGYLAILILGSTAHLKNNEGNVLV